MIKEWLDNYHPANREEAKDALREIMQGIALAAIDSVNMNFVKADISRFIRDPKVLEIWSPSYFHNLTARLKIEHPK